MACVRCGAETVVATATENVAHLGLCAVHLAEARGIATLKPPYRFSGERGNQRGAAQQAWPRPRATAKAKAKTTKRGA